MTEEDPKQELARLEREYSDLFHVDADLLEPDDYRLRHGLLLQIGPDPL